MKRILIIFVALALFVVHGDDLIVGAPVGSPITMTGSAIRFVPNASQAAPMKCDSIFIQPLAGGAAVVYVLNSAPNFVMAKDAAGTTTVAQLGPGSATQPGQAFTFPSNNPGATASGGTDMRYWGVVGTASDQVIATCTVRQ